MKKKSFIVVFITLFAVLVGVGSIWLKSGKDVQLYNATKLQKGKEIPNFSLKYADGQNMNLQNLKGQWDLIFFGFASCPDVCPTGLQTLSNIYKKMQEMEQNPIPKITFISLDPQRDNLEDLGDYVHFFNENFSAATGQINQLNILTAALGVVHQRIFDINGQSVVIKNYEHVPDAIKDKYTINHSATLYLINSEGSLIAYFLEQSDEVEKIVNDLVLIMQDEDRFKRG